MGIRARGRVSLRRIHLRELRRGAASRPAPTKEHQTLMPRISRSLNHHFPGTLAAIDRNLLAWWWSDVTRFEGCKHPRRQRFHPLRPSPRRTISIILFYVELGSAFKETQLHIRDVSLLSMFTFSNSSWKALQVFPTARFAR